MIDIREILTLALRSILRNKSRSILTMLGIIIGVAAVILLVSLGQGLQNYITDQFNQLGTNNIYVLPGRVSLEGGISQGPPNFAGSKLKVEHAQALARLGGPIKDAAAGTEIPAAVKYKGKSKYSTVAGVTGNYPKMFNIEVSKGRMINEGDVDVSRRVAVIGRTVAEDLLGSRNPIGERVTIGEENYEVVGIIKDLSSSAGLGMDINNHVMVPLTAAQRLAGTDSVQGLYVQSTSKDNIPQAKEATKRYLLRQLEEDDFSVVDQANLLSTINSILSVLTAALGGIAAISLVVGGVGIMNIMLVSVTERTREIGLRKAVGAKPNDILLQFVIEAITLSTLGGMIGILIGAGGAELIKQVFPASVSLWSVALAFGVSALVGVVFGVAPAIRASKLNPIDALRYE